MPHTLPQSLAALTEYTQVSEQKFLFHTPEHHVRVCFFTDEIIQLTAVHQGEPFPSFSYAVNLVPQALSTPLRLKETSDTLVIQSSELQLEITKSPLRFRLLNKEGEVLNEDDPSFGTTWQGSTVTTYKTLQEGERFVGLGEKGGGLDRKGNTYTHWNTDCFGYSPDTDPLYVSIPFYMGWHHGRGYGLLLDNSHKSTFDFSTSNNERFVSFGAEGGTMNYFLIGGTNVADILKNYSLLTGRMPMPPRWSLGYQQCRYSYYPDWRVLEVAESMRRRQIPADVLYLDIHYMQDYKVFTWNKERFPDPKALIERLRKMGFRLVLIIDPGVKVEETYEVFDTGQKKDVFVKYPDGTPYEAGVWPGNCHFPDFTKPAVRAWWGKFYEPLLAEGVGGFWNDMNEPAVWGQHVPNLLLFDWEGQTASHAEAHNVYGMQMARATFEAQQQYRPEERPFVLTRAGFAGIQRYAAVWTGDNVAYDDHALLGVRLVSSLGLSGVPFSGYDVGGFVGTPSPELYARWMQLATFAPFFRAHTMINTPSAEPWSYGEETEEISTNYIRLRYRLLPYLYSTFYEAHRTGLPVARSLFIDYPDDPTIYNHPNTFLFGQSLLVIPITSGEGITKSYLPEGDWFDFFTDTAQEGKQEFYIEKSKEKLPVFAKAGAILLEQSLTQHTEETPDETLALHLYAGNTTTTFTFYTDNGVSTKAMAYAKHQILWDSSNRKLSITAKEGNYVHPFKKLRVYLHGYTKAEQKTLLTTHKATLVRQKDFQWIAPISNFDPFFTQDEFPHQISSLLVQETLWESKRSLEIEW